MPVFDERLPIAAAFTASVALHGWALVMPRWHDAHPIEAPVPLTVELRPQPLPMAPAAPTPEPEPAPAAVPEPAPPPPAVRDPPRPAPRAAPPRPPPVATRPTEPSPAPTPSAPPSDPAPRAQADPERPGPPASPPSPAASAPVAAASPPMPRTIPPSFGAAYLRNPPPRYPAEARRNGVEGTVMLRVWVAADGAATRVEIDRSSGHRALDDAAIGAVKKWRFVPARRGDEAIEGLVTVPLVFRLDAAG